MMVPEGLVTFGFYFFRSSRIHFVPSDPTKCASWPSPGQRVEAPPAPRRPDKRLTWAADGSTSAMAYLWSQGLHTQSTKTKLQRLLKDIEGRIRNPYQRSRTLMISSSVKAVRLQRLDNYVAELNGQVLLVTKMYDPCVNKHTAASSILYVNKHMGQYGRGNHKDHRFIMLLAGLIGLQRVTETSSSVELDEALTEGYEAAVSVTVAGSDWQLQRAVSHGAPESGGDIAVESSSDALSSGFIYRFLPAASALHHVVAMRSVL
uniref:MAGE domain-containing protein n=1 Tax=Panagrellus redivivus TaxID=6233 RepID=A0A7E4V1J4_PANRE